MSETFAFGLKRAALSYPALVLSLFFALWMLALVVHAPRPPGFFVFRARAAAWMALAWRTAVFLLDVRSKGRIFAMFDPDGLLSPPSLRGLDLVAALESAMQGEFVGSLCLHALFLGALFLARPLRPSPPAAAGSSP